MTCPVSLIRETQTVSRGEKYFIGAWEPWSEPSQFGGSRHVVRRLPDYRSSAYLVKRMPAPNMSATVACARGVYGPAINPLVRTWLARSRNRLKELQSLQRDWDSYGSAPPNDEAVNAALAVLRELSAAGMPAPRISPSVEEGVCISFRNGHLYADVECFNSGEIVAGTSNGRGEHEVWAVRLDAQSIANTARRIRTYLKY